MVHKFFNAQNQVFLELSFDLSNNWIYANWIGFISHPNVIIGTNALLSLLRETHCPFLLNDNRELKGPWDKSNLYIQNEIVPQAHELGLQYMAHVLAPAVSGALSAQDLHRRISPILKMKLFGDLLSAQNWLADCQFNLRRIG